MMVVSMLNACNINAPNGVLNQQNLDTHHWRQSPQTTSPENDQQNCILNFNTHDQRQTSSPVQNGEDNSSYGSENGADNLSPPQETSRSSGSEDLTSNLFPISSSTMMQQCMEYSNSENEEMDSQASPSSFHDDDSYRGGKGGTGSNGKPKVHKCRTCGFTTTNKHEYWAHNAIHMKPEKILRCPECPFTTEYKHHLDFHMWNHQGVKPHKCDKCPYVCVNKSMLKSHLKSHSNVYQYRCANCSYRTKYCHSLKIHLRRYGHEPGLVLDSEGNPNPNPVIDVYGNRRGPKQKSKKHDHHRAERGDREREREQQHQQQQPIPSTVPPLNAFQTFPPWVNNVFFTENSRIPGLLPASIINTPYAAAAAAAALSDQSKAAATDLTSQDSNDTFNNNLKITNINNNLTVGCNNNNNNNNNNTLFNNNNNNNINDKVINLADAIKRENCSDDEEVFQTCIDEPSSVSPPPPPPNFLLAYDMKRSTSTTPRLPAETTTLPADDAPLNLTVTSSSVVTAQETNNTTPVVKNRRKGVAIKLKHRMYTADDEEDYPTNLSCSRNSSIEANSTNNSIVSSEEKPQSTSDSETDIVAKLKNKKTFFYCDFCEITFFNQVMFTMHMGYHGYSDPFTCNRCGKKTEDNIAFYAHMISSAHL